MQERDQTELERAKAQENSREQNLEKEEISTWNDEGGNSAQYADEKGDIPADGGNSTENSAENRSEKEK